MRGSWADAMATHLAPLESPQTLPPWFCLSGHSRSTADAFNFGIQPRFHVLLVHTEGKADFAVGKWAVFGSFNKAQIHKCEEETNSCGQFAVGSVILNQQAGFWYKSGKNCLKLT